MFISIDAGGTNTRVAGTAELANPVFAGEPLRRKNSHDFDSRIDDQSNSQNRLRDFHAHFSPSSLSDAEVFKKSKMVKKDTPTSNKIVINFTDIQGQSYRTVIGFDSSGISIAEPPKREG